ncbi:hypothetical protein [Alkalispirochaeta sphaeroplastigenens]|uniref:hypothetical protein n=1 Tax=Alkalispirochaeta sphaeroplastigenens TaxID=1187066 RepID=UPI0034DABDC6
MEHKSWYDARAHLQILLSMIQTWEKELRDKPGPRGKTPPQGLSPILPVLVYHGPARRPDRWAL